MRNKKILRYAIIGVASACVAIATFDNGDSKVITYPKSVTVHAAVKQTVTDNYARDDIQSIFSAIQNSSDPVKTDRVLTDEYNKLSKNLTTLYAAPITYQPGYNADYGPAHAMTIADVLHEMSFSPQNIDQNYDSYLEAGGENLSNDGKSAGMGDASLDRNGAEIIYNRFINRLSPANQLNVKTVWEHVQKDDTYESLENDLSSLYQAIADGISAWGENVVVKTNADSDSLYTIKNDKKAHNQYIALYIPQEKIKQVIGRAYKLYKKNRKGIIKSNISVYIFYVLFATYNSEKGQDLQKDTTDGISAAHYYDYEYVKSSGGKTTYNQAMRFLKRAYSYRGRQNIAIKGYYFNHKHPTLKLSKWDGYITDNNLKLKYNPF
ncbi:hypothetical protein [Lentilactobacillus kefiri]|uniref:Uncharacterized protein n=3 Tax=Bacilli TaxID=91061 RepID=A0A8E1V1N0_LENKE|nr:hypothetical protein [Lentilactobacillus kefiri]KRL73288.1 hypothetical protein FD08_GL002773 [Lentilactobacillus parakefiri DSM 10551]KRM50072.1 hypothetical protein FC95_GL002121 [Lentilactobacillus kefiri DSM 20587 = JCM 5818]MCJ2162350.1 hypothetical protein [Lentilactobacillus kefiri]MCP9369614.1 hypothetical protein [Lentilactobacillus kefiri]MDH5108920.1 hypothetical protein [Lentilactobacillus kefiri]